MLIKITKKQVLLSLIGGIIYYFANRITVNLPAFVEFTFYLAKLFNSHGLDIDIMDIASIEFAFSFGVLYPFIVFLTLFFYEIRNCPNKRRMFLNLITGFISCVIFYYLFISIAGNVKDFVLGFFIMILYLTAAPLVTLIVYKFNLFKQ